MKIILYTLLVLSTSVCESYRILAFFPFPGKSHFNALEPIAKGLAEKGHQVDVISYFPLDEHFPNYTDIVKLPVKKSYASITFDMFTSEDKQWEWVQSNKMTMCNLLGHPEVSKIIKNPPNNPPYDLFLVHLLAGYTCISAAGYYMNLPVIGVVTTQIYPSMYRFIGNPLNLASRTLQMNGYKNNLNFWEKVYNFILTRYGFYKFHAHAVNQDKYIKKHLGPNMPSYYEMETNFAALLVNTHYSYYGVLPKTPALIEIGGINIKNDTSELNPKLQKFLDESKDGFIYFSFGSIALMETLPNDVLKKMYTAIRTISPVKVLMRFPNAQTVPNNLPDNVYTFSWIPQQKVLQHPNIKGFVTHAGALGTQEAIYYKVPMLCIPFFAEQPVNCDLLKIKKLALKINIYTDEQKDYDYAFRELITNPAHKERINEFSILYRDRPRSPKDEAVYWIEYVIRHGKNVLKSPTVDMEWWVADLIDVYAFLLVSSITLLIILLLATRALIAYILRKLRSIEFTSFTKKFD